MLRSIAPPVAQAARLEPRLPALEFVVKEHEAGRDPLAPRGQIGGIAGQGRVQPIDVPVEGLTHGVVQHPDMGLTLKGDIHEFGEMKLVWFKDPDGNILHLIEGM